MSLVAQTANDAMRPHTQIDSHARKACDKPDFAPAMAAPAPGVAGARGRGVLITGSHRSGTTWVGQMLAMAPGMCHLHEPFKPRRNLPYIWIQPDVWFLHIDKHNAAQYDAAVARTLSLHYSWIRGFQPNRSWSGAKQATLEWLQWTHHRLRGDRPLIKDPIALFSAPWLDRRFGLDVVVMIRHPAAFVSSIKLKKWYFDFNHFLRQRALMGSLLQPFETELQAIAARQYDLVDQGILQWRIFHHVIARYQIEHPHWHFLRHEDVSREPVAQFGKLAAALGLTFTPECEEAVRRSSDVNNIADAAAADLSTRFININSAGNIRNWQRRLTASEISRIRAGTEDVAYHFYNDQDWR